MAKYRTRNRIVEIERLGDDGLKMKLPPGFVAEQFDDEGGVGVVFSKHWTIGEAWPGEYVVFDPDLPLNTCMRTLNREELDAEFEPVEEGAPDA